MNHPSPEMVRATMRWQETQMRKVFAVGRMKGEDVVLRHRCSWCGEWTQPEPEGEWVATDGMCSDCADDFKEEAGL